MTIWAAKIVNVIQVDSEDGKYFFTLDGAMIGKEIGLMPVSQQPEPPKPVTTKGSVIKPPSPKQIQLAKEVQEEKELTVSERIEKGQFEGQDAIA